MLSMEPHLFEEAVDAQLERLERLLRGRDALLFSRLAASQTESGPVV